MRRYATIAGEWVCLNIPRGPQLWANSLGRAAFVWNGIVGSHEKVMLRDEIDYEESVITLARHTETMKMRLSRASLCSGRLVTVAVGN